MHSLAQMQKVQLLLTTGDPPGTPIPPRGVPNAPDNRQTPQLYALETHTGESDATWDELNIVSAQKAGLMSSEQLATLESALQEIPDNSITVDKIVDGVITLMKLGVDVTGLFESIQRVIGLSPKRLFCLS